MNPMLSMEQVEEDRGVWDFYTQRDVGMTHINMTTCVFKNLLHEVNLLYPGELHGVAALLSNTTCSETTSMASWWSWQQPALLSKCPCVKSE